MLEVGGGVDRVEADGDFALEVAADCVRCQAEPLAGFLVLGTIVIMPGTFRVRPVGLEGVSTPAHKEAEVIRHHAGRCFETKLTHYLLPEVRWTASLLHVGDETMRVSVTWTGGSWSRTKCSPNYAAGMNERLNAISGANADLHGSEGQMVDAWCAYSNPAQESNPERGRSVHDFGNGPAFRCRQCFAEARVTHEPGSSCQL